MYKNYEVNGEKNVKEKEDESQQGNIGSGVKNEKKNEKGKIGKEVKNKIKLGNGFNV